MVLQAPGPLLHGLRLDLLPGGHRLRDERQADGAMDLQGSDHGPRPARDRQSPGHYRLQGRLLCLRLQLRAQFRADADPSRAPIGVGGQVRLQRRRDHSEPGLVGQGQRAADRDAQPLQAGRGRDDRLDFPPQTRSRPAIRLGAGGDDGAGRSCGGIRHADHRPQLHQGRRRRLRPDRRQDLRRQPRQRPARRGHRAAARQGRWPGDRHAAGRGDRRGGPVARTVDPCHGGDWSAGPVPGVQGLGDSPLFDFDYWRFEQ